MESSVKTLAAHYDEFADNATTTLKDAAMSRDYYDGCQLSPGEYAALRRRGQPPIVRNMIQKAIMKILGAEARLRSDPKAYPRTPKDEEGAEAITKGLRFVADNVNLDNLSSNQFEYQIVEGFGGGIVEINPKTLEIDIKIPKPDRLYWDIHSRETDYSDAKYMGIVAWMDADEVKRKWPAKANDIQEYMARKSRLIEHDDKPDQHRWVNPKRNRLLVNQEYYLKDDVWHEAFFCDAAILKNGPSPYLDDNGEPCNPIELESAFVTRQGDRYGLVESMKDAQDEVNKRGSKALHILNVNQTMGEEGAVEDVAEMKREKARPDGHIELRRGALADGRFQFIDQTSELLAHLQMMQEAKAEITELSIDAELSASASGRSRELEQQDQLIKIGRVFDRHRNWKTRIYRQIWARMKQFWDEEKWVRVTDDDDTPEFVGLNIPITLRDQMVAHAEQTGEQIPEQFLADPRLNQVVAVENDVKALDMDIILDESPDYINLQHEVFGKVMEASAASGQPLPLETVIDMMPSLPNKRAIKDKLSGSDSPEAQQQLAQQQAEAERLQEIENLFLELKAQKERADIDKTVAETGHLEAKTVGEEVDAAVAIA